MKDKSFDLIYIYITRNFQRIIKGGQRDQEHCSKRLRDEKFRVVFNVEHTYE